MAKNAPSVYDFSIAVICALTREADAVLAVFDKFWEEDTIIYERAPQDPNSDTTGKVGDYNVVLAHMPEYGKSNAAVVASHLRHSFPNIKIGFIVGVCGGSPQNQESGNIFLGDVIIGTGIVDYDFGRKLPKEFVPKNPLGDTGNAELKAFLGQMQGKLERHLLKVNTAKYLAAPSAIPEDVKPKYLGFDADKLFRTSHRHKHHEPSSCAICAECKNDEDSVCPDIDKLSCAVTKCHELVYRNRPPGDRGDLSTTQEENEAVIYFHKPSIHYGLIGSGDTVMKSSRDRDDLI
jgi:nucleoside phosphorylase